MLEFRKEVCMKYNYKKDKYAVIKKIISTEMADFLGDYLVIRRAATDLLHKTKYISPFETMFGKWGDSQIKDNFNIYGDCAMETLLFNLKNKVEKVTGYQLLPTYAYARIYETGAELKKHKDRMSCEVSSTINLGGDPWPIYLEGIKIDLNKGDMLLYEGIDQEHWREPFEGKECGQVFLHYNIDKPENQHRLYDGRSGLGVPLDCILKNE